MATGSGVECQAVEGVREGSLLASSALDKARSWAPREVLGSFAGKPEGGVASLFVVTIKVGRDYVGLALIWSE